METNMQILCIWKNEISMQIWTIDSALIDNLFFIFKIGAHNYEIQGNANSAIYVNAWEQCYAYFHVLPVFAHCQVTTNDAFSKLFST